MFFKTCFTLAMFSVGRFSPAMFSTGHFTSITVSEGIPQSKFPRPVLLPQGFPMVIFSRNDFRLPCPLPISVGCFPHAMFVEGCFLPNVLQELLNPARFFEVPFSPTMFSRGRFTQFPRVIFSADNFQEFLLARVTKILLCKKKLNWRRIPDFPGLLTLNIVDFEIFNFCQLIQWTLQSTTIQGLMMPGYWKCLVIRIML